jgi:hypothetical protein
LLEASGAFEHLRLPDVGQPLDDRNDADHSQPLPPHRMQRISSPSAPRPQPAP